MQKKPLTLQSSRLIIDRYAQKASENHITPHIFWHTFAASILDEGIDIRYIQSRLPPDANTSWIWLHFDHAEYIYITSKQGCLPKEAERKNRSNYKVKSVVEGRHFLPYGESTVDNQLLSSVLMLGVNEN